MLESRFTGIDGCRVVEVPRLVVVDLVGGRCVALGAQGIALGGLVGQIGFACGSVFLFFFFLFELFDDFLDDFLLLFGRHLRQLEQRVLQGYVARVHSQLVEHVAAVLQELVVGIVLADLRQGLGVAGLCQVILVLCEVHPAQRELADGLVDAVACAFFGGLHIVFDGAGGVAARQVEVADGIIDLVEVRLVAVVSSHAFERAYLAGDVHSAVDGALLDACVELGAVGRAAAAAGVLESAVGQVVLLGFLIELSQQEIQAHFLPAFGSLHGLCQIGDGLLVAVALDIIVGPGQVSQRADTLVGDFVDMDMSQHVVGLGGPPHGAVAQRFPNLRLLHQVGLPQEVARDIAECGSGVQEIALHVLGLGQREPGIVQEGVVLVAFHPFAVFRVAAFARFFLGFLLDGVQGDGLLHLFDGAVEAARGLWRLGVVAGFGRVDEHML